CRGAPRRSRASISESGWRVANGGSEPAQSLERRRQPARYERPPALRPSKIAAAATMPSGRCDPPGKLGPEAASPALAVSAVQARHAAVHQHDCGGAALAAQLRAFGEMTLGERVGLLAARFELGLLLFDELLALVVELRRLEQADHLQVLLDHVAELGNDRRHELAARLPIAAARVEHRLHLLHQERHVAALAEHGGNDARERDDP